jgi:CheY-like chemotaxis protein
VAEDTLALQALIAFWLEEAGHVVTRATNGSEILQLMRTQTFDLLVTDILMPGVDGWEAIEAVRRLYPQTRTLAISGGTREMPSKAVLRVALHAGALGFMAKPFSRVEFLEVVARLLAQRRDSRRASWAEAGAAEVRGAPGLVFKNPCAK